MWCLDTYALVEIYYANEKFTKYLREDAVVPELILVEFYDVLYRKYNEKTADYWLKRVQFLMKKLSTETLIKAVKFRRENKKERISFCDAVGYIYAQENNLRFVTGDKAFKEKPNVEFVTS